MSEKKEKIILAFVVLVVVLIAIVLRLCSYSIENQTKIITAANNEISFNVYDNTRIIHINLNKCSNENVDYSIINPTGKVVSTGKLKESNDFIGEGAKGDWKIIFYNTSDKCINFKVWTGNLESLDILKN